ncbi:MAG: hypothetical protein JWP52_4349 [Rhizobacter sp.]|nr:hypothetical protein [Rhizobacter sp.]
MIKFDIHNHVIPDSYIEAAAKTPDLVGARVEGTGAERRLVHKDGPNYPIFPEFHDVDAKLAVMDGAGIDVAVISPAPPIFGYWTPEADAARIARIVNDGIAKMASARPDRLLPLALMPMHHPDAAMAELERVMAGGVFVGIEIGTTVNGAQIADPKYRPFLKRAAELKALIFAHPMYVDTSCGFGDYYLINLIGNPLDTTMMVAHLMFSGTLDEIPDLQICLAHGGGFVPYQIGRFMHGHKVRPEPKALTSSDPRELLRRFYFDVLLHDPKAIRHLIDRVGPERLMLGTDAPYDMGEVAPVASLDGVPNLSQVERHAICCGTALNLLGALRPNDERIKKMAAWAKAS